MTMKPNFSTWASKLRSKEGDEYGIVSVLPTLALAYNCVCKKSNNIFKKHGQRRAFDEINTIAFSARIQVCSLSLGMCLFNLGIRTEEIWCLLALNISLRIGLLQMKSVKNTPWRSCDRVKNVIEKTLGIVPTTMIYGCE